MKPIRFSEAYEIDRQDEDDWFDPLLNEDTNLSVDPFLIFFERSGAWANGHDKLMKFFNYVLQLLADSGFSEQSPKFIVAKGLLLFKEPPEFALGVSKNSIFGAGSAKGFREGMLRGAALAIKLGLDDLRHIEEIALLGAKIGPDRIGDLTCDVLKDDFVRYTQRVAKRHGVPTTEVNLGAIGGWDQVRKQWKPGLVELPLNPVATELAGRPVGVLLTPKRFLRQMPSVDPEEFWNYAVATEGERLRNEFNLHIGQSVDPEKVARLAAARRSVLTRYVEKLESEAKPPYDVDVDPDLIVRRSDFAKLVSGAFDPRAPVTEDDFVSFVESLLGNFKQCVEQRGGWRMLWVGSKPRNETHVQTLFKISAVMSCQDHDVALSPESNAGRGPVDFSMSRGWRLRALVEAKIAGSSSFRRNLANQTEIYLKAEGCSRGYFLVVQFHPKDFEPDFIKTAEEIAAKVAKEKQIDFKIVWVDARPKTSASKV